MRRLKMDPGLTVEELSCCPSLFVQSEPSNSITTSVSSSSGSSVPLQLGLPVAVPPQYSGLKEVSIEAVRTRLRLLYHFSDLMYSSWRLLNLSPNNQVGKEPKAPVASE